MITVQSLDHNIITGTQRNRVRCGTTLDGRVRVGRDSCVRENKGVLTLSNLNRARARLTPKTTQNNKPQS